MFIFLWCTDAGLWVWAWLGIGVELCTGMGSFFGLGRRSGTSYRYLIMGEKDPIIAYNYNSRSILVCDGSFSWAMKAGSRRCHPPELACPSPSSSSRRSTSSTDIIACLTTIVHTLSQHPPQSIHRRFSLCLRFSRCSGIDMELRKCRLRGVSCR